MYHLVILSPPPLFRLLVCVHTSIALLRLRLRLYPTHTRLLRLSRRCLHLHHHLTRPWLAKSAPLSTCAIPHTPRLINVRSLTSQCPCLCLLHQSRTLAYYAAFLLSSGLAGFAMSGFQSKARTSLIMGQPGYHPRTATCNSIIPALPVQLYRSLTH